MAMGLIIHIIIMTWVVAGLNVIPMIGTKSTPSKVPRCCKTLNYL